MTGVVSVIAVGGAVAAATLLSPANAERWDALDAYDDAVALNDDSRAALLEAERDVDRIIASLVAAAELAEVARELDGVVISGGAVDALIGSVGALSFEPYAREDLPAVTRIADPGSLSIPELRAAAGRVITDTIRVENAIRARTDFISAAEASMADFTASTQAFVSTLIERGEHLLASRTDAAEDALSALRNATDEVAGESESPLTERLRAWSAAALEVVRTSNAERIDDPDSVVVVVNKRRPLQPQNYVPSLVHVGVRHLWSPLLRAEAAEPLVRMFAAFEAETGLQLRLQNSYRSFATQTDTYGYHVATKGQAQADRGSARPGHSEHQTGLALDVDGVGYGCSIQQCFGDLVHGKWLEANAWRFGWVIRYPKGYEHITGYDWEPWHLRYVGVDVSTAMHKQGIATLEEYFGLEPAPTYP